MLALFLTTVVIDTLVGGQKFDNGEIIRQVLILGMSGFIYWIWGIEDSAHSDYADRLRELLVSRRTRESEAGLYDDYIRFRHFASAADRRRTLEKSVWLTAIAIGVMTSILSRFWRL